MKYEDIRVEQLYVLGVGKIHYRCVWKNEEVAFFIREGKDRNFRPCMYLIPGEVRNLNPAPVMHKVWVNCYTTHHAVYESRERADMTAGFRIACVELEYEEGQGL